MIYKFILAASLPILAGIITYKLFKGREKSKRARVSDEGYETAYDVLFPKKKIKRYRFHNYIPQAWKIDSLCAIFPQDFVAKTDKQ